METNNKTAVNTTAQAAKPELSNLVVTGGVGKDAKSQAQETKTEKPVKTKEEKPAPSIADRLKKLNKLNQLNERRTDLVDALDDVNGFILSPANPAKITFTDGKGNSFSVSHQGVIGDMVALAKKRLESEIEIVDNQIVFD